MGEVSKRRTRLKELLERPEARPRVSRAVASLLAVTVASIGLLGALVLWHLLRRGRLIRERLGPPRDVRLPTLEVEPPVSQPGSQPEQHGADRAEP